MAVRPKLFGEAVNQSKLPYIVGNEKTKLIPPINSHPVNEPAQAEVKHLSKELKILDFPRQLINAEHLTSRLFSPTLVSCNWCAAEIYNQVPVTKSTWLWERVLGMKQQDSFAHAPPAEARPSKRRTHCSREGEDLMAQTARLRTISFTCRALDALMVRCKVW